MNYVAEYYNRERKTAVFKQFEADNYFEASEIAECYDKDELELVNIEAVGR